MRLTSVQIEGFKRFGDKTVLRVRGRSMAILGANESGKTSLLEAIEHLGKTGFPGATQFTDRQTRPASAVVLSARFAIEQPDLDAVNRALENRPVVGDLNGGEPYTLRKLADGSLRIPWDSGLSRDTAYRDEWVRRLDELAGSDWDPMPIQVYDDAGRERMRSVLFDARSVLATASEQLDKDAIAALEAARGTLTDWASRVEPSSPDLEAFRAEFDRLVDEERADAPGRAASLALYARLPAFLRFRRGFAAAPDVHAIHR